MSPSSLRTSSMSSKPFRLRHAEIGDEHVRCRMRAVGEPRQCLIARRHHGHVGAEGTKSRRSQVARVRVIVDNQNPDAD